MLLAVYFVLAVKSVLWTEQIGAYGSSILMPAAFSPSLSHLHSYTCSAVTLTLTLTLLLTSVYTHAYGICCTSVSIVVHSHSVLTWTRLKHPLGHVESLCRPIKKHTDMQTSIMANMYKFCPFVI